FFWGPGIKIQPRSGAERKHNVRSEKVFDQQHRSEENAEREPTGADGVEPTESQLACRTFDEKEEGRSAYCTKARLEHLQIRRVQKGLEFIDTG
ncbi:MAG TPA: hypothetical protein VMR80_02230, partial [Candidatus Acidoferrum sp.]|nr:hypothetical protein [Candidatus Acidoferrum sp.]